MVILKIYNVEKNDTGGLLSTFEVGEHVIGRGSFANCVDKKISRRHIVINVKDNEATLTLIHVSPIFLMSQNSSHIQILKKGNSIKLSDGDKFAFLIDTWYTIKIEENQGNNGNSAASSASTVPIANPASSNTVVASTSNTVISQSTSCKRSSDELYSEERKKLKLQIESLDKLKDNIDKIVSHDYKNSTDENKGSLTEVTDNNTTEVFKGKDISDSDDDSDAEMLPEITCDTEVVNGTQVHSNENLGSHNTDEDGGKFDILDDIKKEPMIEDVEVPNIKTEPQDEESMAINGKELDDSNAEEFSSSVKNEDETTVETPEDNEIAKVSNQDPTDASASSSRTSNRLRREKCWFGQECYRKNPGHKDQFSHPGDSDHAGDSDDDSPQCPYGAQCYRRNPQHRKDYKHPTSRPAPGPSTSNKRKRKQNLNNQGDMDYDSDSLDEGDPFSADESSSASEVFEGGDSDSDYMEEPNPDDMDDSEEVKVMFKEAKKFLRRNR